MARKIILLNGEARERQRIASEILSPGELVLPAATEGEVKANDDDADTDAQRAWVREQRENEGADASTDIAAGDDCTIIYPDSGAVINARIAHGESLDQGDALESDGAGALQAHTSGRIVAYAEQDIANTSGAAELHPVRVA